MISTRAPTTKSNNLSFHGTSRVLTPISYPTTQMSYGEYIHVTPLSNEQEPNNAHDQCIPNHDIDHGKHESNSHMLTSHVVKNRSGSENTNEASDHFIYSLSRDMTSSVQQLIKNMCQEYQHHTASMSVLNPTYQPTMPYSHK